MVLKTTCLCKTICLTLRNVKQQPPSSLLERLKGLFEHFLFLFSLRYISFTACFLHKFNHVIYLSFFHTDDVTLTELVYIKFRFYRFDCIYATVFHKLIFVKFSNLMIVSQVYQYIQDKDMQMGFSTSHLMIIFKEDPD